MGCFWGVYLKFQAHMFFKRVSQYEAPSDPPPPSCLLQVPPWDVLANLALLAFIALHGILCNIVFVTGI